jgi:hypothetical protein
MRLDDVDGRDKPWDKPGHDGLGSRCHAIRFIQGDRPQAGTNSQ